MGDTFGARLFGGAATATRRPFLLRFAVPGVALAGALALGWTGWLSDTRAVLWLTLAGAALAVVSAALWEWHPRLGDLLLRVVGAIAMALAGVPLLAGGALPWLLVGFWGGAALVLASTLDLMTLSGEDRSSTATVLAVVTLLLLSAAGLASYVRAYWSPAERRLLQTLPIIPSDNTSPFDTVVRYEPQTSGQWGATWSENVADPGANVVRMQRALEADGWRVARAAPMALYATKGVYTLELVEESASPGTPAEKAGVRITVHVGEKHGAAVQ